LRLVLPWNMVDNSKGGVAKMGTPPVLATSDIRSENRHLENGISFLYRLQTKKGKGKMGSRQ
ncbi:MAG TPA: hypothetical protein VF844_21175, partial [Ktedonobacteraceae bacterium]